MNASRNKNDDCLALKVEVVYQMLLYSEPYIKFKEMLYTMHRIRKRYHCKCDCFWIGDKNQSEAECIKIMEMYFANTISVLTDSLGSGNSYSVTLLKNLVINFVNSSEDGYSDGSFKVDILVSMKHDDNFQNKVRGIDMIEFQYDDDENKVKTITHTVNSINKTFKKYHIVPTDIRLLDDLSDCKINVYTNNVSDHVYIHQLDPTGVYNSYFEKLLHGIWCITMFFVGCLYDLQHGFEVVRKHMNKESVDRAYFFKILKIALRILCDPKWTSLLHFFQHKLNVKKLKHLKLCIVRFWTYEPTTCKRFLINYHAILLIIEAMEKDVNVKRKTVEWRDPIKSIECFLHLIHTVDNGFKIFVPLSLSNQKMKSVFPFERSLMLDNTQHNVIKGSEIYGEICDMVSSYKQLQFNTNYNIIDDIQKYKEFCPVLCENFQYVITYNYKGIPLNSLNLRESYQSNYEDDYKNFNPREVLSDDEFTRLFGEEEEEQDNDDSGDYKVSEEDQKEMEALGTRVRIPRQAAQANQFNPFDDNTYVSTCSVHCIRDSKIIKCTNVSCGNCVCLIHVNMGEQLRETLLEYEEELLKVWMNDVRFLCDKCIDQIVDIVESYKTYLENFGDKVFGDEGTHCDYKTENDYFWKGLSVDLILLDCKELSFVQIEVLLQLYDKDDYINKDFDLFVKLYKRYVDAAKEGINVKFEPLFYLTTMQLKAVFINTKKWIIKHIMANLNIIKDDEYPLTYNKNVLIYKDILYMDLGKVINT
eukprot:83322_1